MANPNKFSFNKLALRISSNSIVLSLREGYIALIPFFVVASLITLITQFVNYAHIAKYHSYLTSFNTLIWTLFPILSLISVSYHLSKNLRLNSVSVPVLVLLCFVVATDYVYLENNVVKVDNRSGVIYSLILPIVCSYLMAWLVSLKKFRIVEQSDISLFLRKHLNLIIPYFIVTLLVLGLFPLVNGFFISISEQISHFQIELSPELKMLNQLVVSHLLWFFGIHGDNTVQILFPPDLTYFPLTPTIFGHQFYSAFVILGGTGCIWGLIIASLFIRTASHERQVARLASPFAIFNISEIMIYALPIVFNPFLFLPFILAPIINMIVSLYAIQSGFITIVTNADVPWFTPVIVSGWWLTESYRGVLLQLLLIAVNAMLYFPFLKKSLTDSVSGKASDLLTKRFTAGNQVLEQVESNFAQLSTRAKLSAQSLEDVSNVLSAGELTLYYQPKFDPIEKSILGFEALLRLKTKDGQIQGPWFLEELQQHNLMHIIDGFVIDKLEVDLLHFRKLGLAPKVSFNISPVNLLNGGYKRVIKAFAKFPGQVEVELLESSYIEDYEKTRNIVELLKDNHISCAMDDFGTGYSCLTVLAKLNIKTIKLDRSLLPSSSSEKGEKLYCSLAYMCHELGFELVAEGVENHHDEELVCRAGINCVQGFLYSKAVSLEEAVAALRQPQSLTSS